MYIDPNYAIEQGWIKFPSWMDDEYKAKCIQPNAIDVTADVLRISNYASSFVLSEQTKQMRQFTELRPRLISQDLDNDPPQQYWHIPADTVVDVQSDFFVDIPSGVAAFLIVRSTLNRNGLFVTSGLYDQGFNNYIGFMLHNRGNFAYLAPHTRVAQCVFVRAEDSGKMYQGTYNNNVGQHWTSLDKQETTDGQQCNN